MTTFTITPSGPYSLRESAEFGFGGRDRSPFDGVMRLAFVLDGYQTQVGVELRQDPSDGPYAVGGRVHGIVHADPDVDVAVVRRQVARMLSLDHDASGFAAIGARDPVIGRLQEVAPGLLPPLFHSPYEAALWAVLSARRPAQQMADVRRRLAQAHGRVFDLAGQRIAAVPTPQQLQRVSAFPGLNGEKIDRLHGIARAAERGTLDADRLQRLGPTATDAEMQHLKGIGPFYASLITIRATGFADVPPADEPIVRELVGQLYHLPDRCTREQFLEIAERWRPYRTWAAVLIRAAAGRPAPASHGSGLAPEMRRRPVRRATVEHRAETGGDSGRRTAGRSITAREASCTRPASPRTCL